jgi:O-antigen/teichoic acid export membrane protein
MFTFARHGMRLWKTWDRRVGATILRAAAPLGAIVIVNYLYFRLDLFLLSLLGTRADVARYGVSYKVIEALILVPAFVMTTLLPDAARAAPFSERLDRIVRNAVAAMQLIALPLIALSFFSLQILRLIAGAAYAPAAFTLQLLMIGVAISFVQQVFGYTLVAQNRQLQALYVLVGVLLLNLVLNLILIPLFAIKGAAIALVVSEVASLVGTAAVYSRIGTVPRMYLPFRTAAAAGVMATVVVATRVALPTIVPSAFVTLAVGGVLSSAAYLLILQRLHAVPPAISSVAGDFLRRRRLRASHS